MRIHIVAFTCLCTLITKDGQMFGYYPNASKTHLIQWRSVSVVRPWTKCTNGARGGGGGGGCCRLLARALERGGYLAEKREGGRGGALYYMNGFTTAPGICPCVCEFDN